MYTFSETYKVDSDIKGMASWTFIGVFAAIIVSNLVINVG
jgi:hypothetical protein